MLRKKQGRKTAPPRAITRNGRIYLPLNIVVDFFGLRSSYLHTDYGYLVRIKNRVAAEPL